MRGAARLAAQFGIPPLIIGLTVVPRHQRPGDRGQRAGLAGGSGDIAIGNVIGSNIANVLLILARPR